VVVDGPHEDTLFYPGMSRLSYSSAAIPGLGAEHFKFEMAAAMIAVDANHTPR
jgi:hypothetical protein